VELPGCFETIQERHRDVEQNQIRPQLLRRLNQRTPILHRTHHLAFTLDQLPQAGEDQRVVIGHEHARFLHARS
jgi:hypothetical protein